MSPLGRLLARLAGAVLLGWTVREVGLSLPAAFMAAAAVSALIVPPGVLASRLLPLTGLLPGERALLVAVIGYPLGAASYYALCLLGRPGLMLPLLLVAASAAMFLLHVRTRVRPEPCAAPSSVSPHWSLFILVPLALLVMTRGSRAFVPTEAGLSYDHSVDHSVHLAFYWELLKGVPPQQLPTAAGIPFPSYHVLSFMPGLFLIRHGGLHVATVYHAVSPLLRLSLLMGAVYLAVRLRTNDGRLATAAVAALLLVAPAVDDRLDDRFVEGPTPHYFFVRSESGGGGIVVWAAVLALLALYGQARADTSVAPRATAILLLASVLAGLSFSFKAQLFVLFGGAYALALVLLFLRDRSRHLLAALAAVAAVAGLCFWASLGHGSLGRLYFTPGRLAELYVLPNLRRDPSEFVRATLTPRLESLGSFGLALATILGLWRLVRFSPFVPAFVVGSLRRFRVVGLLDLVCALAFVLGLPMAYGFSVRAIDHAISPFEFLQAAHGLAMLAAVIDVAVLARLCVRWARDGGRWVLGAALLASAGALPLLLSSKPYVPPRQAIVLGPDEQCALLFLRLGTPPEAVVVSDRTESAPGLARTAARLNHQAVVAGFAGRRAVLEYYGREVDPWTNRWAAIRRLFATADAAEAEAILRRYGVDYVLELAGLPLKFPRSALRLAYAHGEVRVYHFQRDGGPEPAGPPATPPGLGPIDGGLDLGCRP